MLPEKYLRGLNTVKYEIPGIYYVRHPRRPASFLYLSSYATGTDQKSKAKLFGNVAKDGQLEVGKTWEWHHVVEGQHYADVDVTGQLDVLYAAELPCVLLAAEEHRAFNSILHCGATDLIYRDPTLPKAPSARSQRIATLALDRENHPKLRTGIARIRQLYRDTYEGYSVLSKISDNVFDDVLSQLK